MEKSNFIEENISLFRISRVLFQFFEAHFLNPLSRKEIKGCETIVIIFLHLNESLMKGVENRNIVSRDNEKFVELFSFENNGNYDFLLKIIFQSNEIFMKNLFLLIRTTLNTYDAQIFVDNRILVESKISSIILVHYFSWLMNSFHGEKVEKSLSNSRSSPADKVLWHLPSKFHELCFFRSKNIFLIPYKVFEVWRKIFWIKLKYYFI